MQNLVTQFQLRPDIIFLNHGSFGACPRPVFAEYQRWQLELERQPVEFLGRRFDDLLQQAREPLAEFVHCAADELVYVPNVTVGLNTVARSLQLESGDEILTTDHEYGALDRTWTFLCEKAGAVYKHQSIPLPVTTPADFVEQFWAGVTPRTRIIFLSHITSPTALIFPIQEICRRARQANIITVVDGAHSVGQIPLDLTALDADFYSSNCHKWLMSPKGSAFLYSRRDKQALVEPLVVSWGWRPRIAAASRFVQEQEWQGTRDIAAYLSVPTAIQFFRDNDWASVQAECHAVAKYAQAKMSALTGLEPISDDAWFAQMLSVPLPPCDVEAVKTRLYEEYRIEVPIIEWNERQFVRISIQGYNTRGDVDALVQGLENILYK